MFFDRFFKRNRMPKDVQTWLKKQSHPEDALQYLIEKELYEHGQRDFSFVIPRKRNDAYFAELLDRESHAVRKHSNLAMYDAIAQVHTEQPSPTPYKKERPQTLKPVPRSIEKVGTVPSSSGRKGLSGVNKGLKIYNTTSSSVVVTQPEEKFEHDVDLTCFED